MSSNIRFVELSSYDIPKPLEVKGKEWVGYGDNNDYYETLLELKNSPTNSALINSITDLIYGRGLKATNSSADLEGWANFLSILSEHDLRCLTDDYYTLGQGFLQVIWDKSHNKVEKVYHTPTQNWRPGKCNADGDIEAYYYHDDWANAKPSDDPMRVPAFGTSKESIEIICIKPYRAGHFYFTPVEYQSGLPYAEVEIEVAKYHINNIHNKFSANHIINFNNGRPEDDEMDAIEAKIKRKFTGSEGDGIVVAFNRSAEEAADVQTVQLANPHEQYQFIAEEAARKLMVSHRVVSPVLVGLKTESGIGSNADELRMASQLFDNTVIKPLQRQLIEGIEPILTANGYSFNLYFETLQPLEFTEMETEDIEDEKVEEKVGVEMAEVEPICCSKHEGDNLDSVVDDLISLGEDEDLEDWDLISEQAVNYLDEEEEQASQTVLSKLWNLVSTGTAKPNAKSEQDKGLFKVRYQYAPSSTSSNSRDFCRKMVGAGKLYRKEDIVAMENKAVNPGWGPNGSNTYSIWYYKGGGDCHHFWMRKVYMRKRGAGGKFLPNEGLANDKPASVNDARKAGVPLEKNDAKVAKLPTDMPNNGFLKPR